MVSSITVYKLFVLDKNTWYHKKKLYKKKCKYKHTMYAIP